MTEDKELNNKLYDLGLEKNHSVPAPRGFGHHIDELNKKITDLEAKLAESQNTACKHIAELTKIATEKDKQIEELKQQLAEKEAEIEEVRSNHANLVADIAYKAVNVYTAESKKTGVPTFYKIHYSQLLKIEDMENLRNYTQDKISFAVEKIQELKKFTEKEIKECNKLLQEEFEDDYYIQSVNARQSMCYEFKREIDNQINVLRNNKDGIH